MRFAKKRSKRAEDIASTIEAAHDLKIKISTNKEKLQTARKLLASIRRQNQREVTFRLLNTRFEGLLREIDFSLSDTSLLLCQRLMTEASHYSRTKHVRTYWQQKRKSRYFAVPKQTKIVAEKYLDCCLDTIYGSSFRERHDHLTPVVTVWPHPEYRHSPHSRTISIPPHDAAKMCRWSSLAHEICHSKIHNIMRALRPRRESDEVLAEALLGKEWKAIDKMWGELERRFVKQLRLRIGNAYRMIYSLWNDDFAIPKYFLGYQFMEILCDVATVKICGPADLFVLGWTTAPNCRNPFYGISRHLLDLIHPPDIVRLRCEFDILQTGENDLRNTSKFTEIGDLLDGLIGFDVKDIDEENLGPNQSLSIYMIEAYTEVIRDLLEKDISPLVNLILGNRRQFGRDRWRKIIQCYEDMDRGSSLTNKDLEPYDLTNIAWLKVWSIYRRTVEKGLTFRDFRRLRKKEQQFFKDLWISMTST